MKLYSSIITSLLLASFANAQSWELSLVDSPSNFATTKAKKLLLSNDGSTFIVAYQSTSEQIIQGTCETFRWQLTTGYENIGTFCPEKINHDGSIIFGNIGNFPKHTSYFWQEHSGLQTIPSDDPNIKMIITDMDYLGKTFVGYSYLVNELTAWPMQAFVLHNDNIQYLDKGTAAIGVSDDGNTILVQNNDWSFDQKLTENYDLTFKTFMDLYHWQQYDDQSQQYIQAETNIRRKAPKKSPPKVITGIWEPQNSSLNWLGEYYPLEISANGRNILAYVYRDQSRYDEPILTQLNADGEQTFFKTDRNNVAVPKLLRSGILPLNAGYKLWDIKKNRQLPKYPPPQSHCDNLLASALHSEKYICIQKDFFKGYQPKIIHNGRAELLEDWLQSNTLPNPFKFANSYPIIWQMSDDGKTLLGQAALKDSLSNQQIFLIQNKETTNND